jgi:hypothetical protein
MASWAPPLRTATGEPRAAGGRLPHAGVTRVGGHIVADRDLALVKARLVAMESMIERESSSRPEDRAGTALRRAAQERVHRDLELLSGALRRSA